MNIFEPFAENQAVGLSSRQWADISSTPRGLESAHPGRLPGVAGIPKPDIMSGTRQATCPRSLAPEARSPHYATTNPMRKCGSDLL